MIIDPVGNLLYQTTDLIDLVYTRGIDSWSQVCVTKDHETDKYKRFVQQLDLPEINTCEPDTRPVHQVDEQNQSISFMPEQYKTIDVLSYCLERCSTDKERERVIDEHERYVNHDMISILQYMIYLMDVVRENNIIIGVGRGSSVSSFILYLIGVHRINPLQYDLDHNEFFKDKEKEKCQ